MTLWVDGDSCPRPAMEIILKFAKNPNLEVIVAADRIIPGVEDAGAQMRLFSSGSGSVDDSIVEDSSPGDLAVTRDYGLGLRLKRSGVTVLNDRGEKWDLKELQDRAADAEIMRAMRAGGMVKKQPRSYGKEDIEDFAASLEALVGLD